VLPEGEGQTAITFWEGGGQAPVLGGKKEAPEGGKEDACDAEEGENDREKKPQSDFIAVAAYE